MHLRDLFREDPGRGERLTLEAGDLYLDYSKHLVTDETIGLLLALADRAGLRDRIEAMFRGDRINVTEDRPALHVALRAPRGEVIEVDGHDVVPDVHEVLDRMSAFSERVRGGDWTGATGATIRDVVNIGIGGSDLGPAMATEALTDFSRRDMTFRFVSNVDGTDIAEATRDLEPARTLFIVSSKTFTTLETLTNAGTAPGLADRRARRGGRREALRRRQHERGGRPRLRHRPGEHVRLLGLGGRPLLGRLGDRPVADDRDRARGLPRDADRLPRRRRALPHGAVRAEHAGADGPAGRLVRRLLRRADARDPAVQPAPREVPRVPAAARHGVERQVGGPGRRARRRADRPGGVGHARHERPARVLPADPSGHGADPGRLHRVRAREPPDRARTTTC